MGRAVFIGNSKFLLLILMGMALLGFLFLNVELDKVFALLSGAPPEILLGILALDGLILLVRIARWSYLLKPFNLNISRYHKVSSYLGSLFISNVTPARVGEMSRAYFIKKRYGGNMSNLVPLIIVERFLDIGTLIAFSIVSLVMFSGAIVNSFFFVIGIASVILALSVYIVFNKSFFRWFVKKFFSAFRFSKRVTKYEKQAAESIGKFYNGVFQLKNSNFLVISMFTFISWILEAMILFFVGVAIVPSLFTPGFFLISIGFTAVAIIGGTLSSLPGALGSLEAILFTMFALLGFTGEVALSIALLYRFMSYVLVMGFSSVFFVREMV
ncbi:MAG: flippase-like domain-containing protein [DPANN group archaeon]|nr:flippase-like domain-containing protein [DPANN group archaeon]